MASAAPLDPWPFVEASSPARDRKELLGVVVDRALPRTSRCVAARDWTPAADARARDFADASADTARMGAGSTAPRGRVVGRAVEGTFLTAAMQAAAQGEPQAVFVHGEAGVGKTSLVREVLGSFAGEVLWGTCV